jgi:hypothetical protein
MVTRYYAVTGSIAPSAYLAIYPMTGWVERQNAVECNQQDGSRE